MKIDNGILDDYRLPDDLTFCNDDEKVIKLKQILFEDMDDVERNIIILYAELGSLRKLGAELGISASSAYLKVKQLRDKIAGLL